MLAGTWPLNKENQELGHRRRVRKRTFQKIVNMELSKACCAAALKEMALLPIITLLGTQSLVEIPLLSLQKYSSSPKPAQLEDK